jgi:hypothetical protein
MSLPITNNDNIRLYAPVAKFGASASAVAENEITYGVRIKQSHAQSVRKATAKDPYNRVLVGPGTQTIEIDTASASNVGNIAGDVHALHADAVLAFPTAYPVYFEVTMPSGKGKKGWGVFTDLELGGTIGENMDKSLELHVRSWTDV